MRDYAANHSDYLVTILRMPIIDTEAYLSHFENMIDRWDEEAKGLTDEQRNYYEAHRDNFLGRLHAWRARVEEETTTLADNLDEGFNELEARWLEIKREQ